MLRNTKHSLADTCIDQVSSPARHLRPHISRSLSEPRIAYPSFCTWLGWVATYTQFVQYRPLFVCGVPTAGIADATCAILSLLRLID
jgi:hypothetical protein